jgi:Gpi18-like mannosyltransferase
VTLLALITRPNAIVLTPLMVIVAWKSNQVEAKLRWVAFWFFVGLYGFLYYLPYYFVHETNASNTHYWGLYPSDYYTGIWLGLPQWVGQPTSWLIFLVSKLLYAVGLRPSYSDLPGSLVVLRALPGLLFLPGLVYGLIKGRSFDRVFVVVFLIPVFVGAAQERYLLAITPLLSLWGFQAMIWLWNANMKPRE